MGTLYRLWQVSDEILSRVSAINLIYTIYIDCIG